MSILSPTAIRSSSRATPLAGSAVANGTYLVTICCGDSGHEQTGHYVAFEGQVAVEHEATAAGRYVERTVRVEVRDGRLTMNLGPQQSGSNTCVNWIRFQKQ